MTQAYPLQWPVGWKRTPPGARKRARFNATLVHASTISPDNTWKERRVLSVADSTKRILAELRALDVSSEAWVISTNLILRQDGLPRSEQRAPEDPGAAVYWLRRGWKTQKVMAVDFYDRVADNLAAIAATLSAMRAIERHGGAQILDRAFTGFDALPAPGAFDPFAILALRRPATAEAIEAQFRALAKKHHPDAGGDASAFADLVRARDQALQLC